MFVTSFSAFVVPASQERQSTVKATITSVHEGDRGNYGSNLPKFCTDFASSFGKIDDTATACVCRQVE